MHFPTAGEYSVEFTKSGFSDYPQISISTFQSPMVSAHSTKRKRSIDNQNEVESKDAITTTTTSRVGSSSEEKKNSPVIIFAHGAGAPSSSEWMIRWRNLLIKTLNPVDVVAFDYPYISGRRKAPPNAEKLVEYHSDVVKKTAEKYPGHPLILAGKSMGSRISCMVAATEDIGASAVICLGYPLKNMKGAVRDETLLQLPVPIMFVQGSKDCLCPLDLLESVRAKMQVANALHVIEAGDHSFQIGKKHLELTGSTHEQAEEQAVQAIAIFVSRVLAGWQPAVSSGGGGTHDSCRAAKESSGLLTICEANISANFNQLSHAGGCKPLSQSTVNSCRNGTSFSPMKKCGRNVLVRSQVHQSNDPLTGQSNGATTCEGDLTTIKTTDLPPTKNKKMQKRTKPSTNVSRPMKPLRRSMRSTRYRKICKSEPTVIVID